MRGVFLDFSLVVWLGMLELSGKEFKSAMIDTLNTVIDKVGSMQEQTVLTER